MADDSTARPLMDKFRDAVKEVLRPDLLTENMVNLIVVDFLRRAKEINAAMDARKENGDG